MALRKIATADFNLRKDIVCVGSDLFGEGIELRFGDGGRGSRTARLKTSDARLIAYALFARADECDADELARLKNIHNALAKRVEQLEKRNS
jgi:hypothetical protein